jgi:hypothetical protein
MSIHPADCECDTYGCKRRREGLFALSSAATPTRARHLPFRDPAKVNHTSWENGMAGEHRPDGSFMPYLRSDGGPLKLKEYSENRSSLDDIRRRQLSGTSIEKVS